jgi:hypothetical protein
VREKNQNLIGQYQQDQEKAATEALNQQNTELVEANTRLKVEKEKAEQNKEVEEKKLKQELEAAQIRLEAARNQAKALVTRGQAEATVINAQNEAEVSGLRTAVRGFPSADDFAQYQVLSRLAPALTEIFASDTSEFAKLFATWMTPPRKVGAAPPRADAAAAAVMPPASK